MKQKKKLSKAEMRVTLAKDVIRTIKYNQSVVVTEGQYLGGSLGRSIEDMIDEDLDGSIEKQDARDVIKRLLKDGAICSICAKGALLLSHVLRNDKMTLGRFNTLISD